MAWTAPRTWVVGELVTAAIMNTHIRDNLTFLHPAPAARVYHNANQNVNHNTVTTLAFNSERYDNDSIHDNAVNNSRLTCKTAGKYLIVGQVQWTVNATGEREAYIYLNGSTNIGGNAFQTGAVGGDAFNNVSTVYDLSVNDYVELQVFQLSGGALNAIYSAAQEFTPEFMMVMVG